MLKRNSKQWTKKRKATFSIYSADAKEVYLIGSFNDWSPKKHPMNQNSLGVWKKTVIIPPGIYEYKFLIDGQWTIDPQNGLTCMNCFGTKNSVLDFTRE